MVDIFRKYKKIIIIVAVLILAFIIYSYWNGGSSNNNVLTATGGAATNGSPTLSSNPQVGLAFLNQLTILQNVSLNDSIFSDPSFQSLQDFSQPIPEEQQGRPNPFAPIGVDVSNGPTISATGTNNNVNFTIQSAPNTHGTISSPTYGPK